jgi:hypothetical protein
VDNCTCRRAHGANGEGRKTCMDVLILGAWCWMRKVCELLWIVECSTERKKGVQMQEGRPPQDAQKGKLQTKCRLQRQDMRAALARQASSSSDIPTFNSSKASANSHRSFRSNVPRASPHRLMSTALETTPFAFYRRNFSLKLLYIPRVGLGYDVAHQPRGQEVRSDWWLG